MMAIQCVRSFDFKLGTRSKGNVEKIPSKLRRVTCCWLVLVDSEMQPFRSSLEMACRWTALGSLEFSTPDASRYLDIFQDSCHQVASNGDGQVLIRLRIPKP
jgi:hypothetical protein